MLSTLSGFPTVAALLVAAALRGPGTASQVTQPPEQLHGVLGRTHLSPPLRAAPQQIRFSPDGKYLLIQFESGIYILNRRPLQIQTWIYAPDILPARFSADSKTLVLATRSLAITQWNLADNRRSDETILKKQGGCLA
jgi:hypothetical protein